MTRIAMIRLPLCALLVTCSSLISVTVQAHEDLEPGFNIFSKRQDVEIGQQSAAQVEQQLPMLPSSATTQLVENVTSRLAAGLSNSAFSYRARVVNVSDVNAFALPGGYMYVNRGLIEAADSEGQLAGVMAHEMAHVALRHGTNQASKAYLAQAGLSILGGIIGGNRSQTSDIVNALGGFGLNALFLKYSRDDESEADALGARMMANAGYDPNEMADFFEKLRQAEARDPSKFEQFFSDHPSPGDRAEHIRAEAGAPKPASARQSSTYFARAESELRSMGRAPSMQQLASGEATTSSGPSVPSNGTGEVQIAKPSSRFSKFTQRDRIYSISYPSNWRVYGSSGYGVSIVPTGGVVNGGDEPVIVYGVVMNHYMPVNASSTPGRNEIERATNEILTRLQESNSYLRPVEGSGRYTTLSGGNALSAVLAGKSPFTGEEERITVFTRMLPDRHVLYALFIAPGQDYQALNQTYSKMIKSVRVNVEDAVHP